MFVRLANALTVIGCVLIGSGVFYACAAHVAQTAPITDPEPPKQFVREFTFPLALPGNTKVCVESNKPVMSSVRCMTLAELRAILYGHKL